MKKNVLVLTCSISLLSLSSVAGATCLYHGDGYAKAEYTPIEDQLAADVANEAVDPNLLALLKKQQAGKSKIKPIRTFN